MHRLLEEISASVQRLYREAVDPLEQRYAFEKRPSAGEIAGPPTVLFLGNHSSGKSTFINYLLGSPVQKTGLAPTDDAFTVLAHGATDEERDGPSLVTNPNLPFGPLGAFGPTLVSHLRMKLRPAPILKDVTLIDSPGMIDAAKEGSGRGYDYAAAVRWLAERSDLVLVFFDPEKPGTTGETLQVFTQALRGLDHKLLVVMNKVDQFRSLHDFARAYGALCWNLGKVIPRKDLPHVFTTYIPVPGAAPPVLPMDDFERAREELVREIRRAPARRADNMLTQLRDHGERLRVHVRIVDAAAGDVRRFRARSWLLLVLVSLVIALSGTVALLAQAQTWLIALLYGLSAVILYGGAFVIRALVRSRVQQAVDALPALFERLYARDLVVRERADDLRARWAEVHPRTQASLASLGLLSFPRVNGNDMGRLEQALEREVPDLRARLHRELSAEASAAR